MSRTNTLEDYLKVKTGQDLIDLGVVPKTSSEHLALIAKKRLEALREHILATINPEALGVWIPLVEPVVTEANELSNPQQIMSIAKEGMKARSNAYPCQGLEGTIRIVENGRLGIEFPQRISGGNNLGGKCANYQGYFLSPEQLTLLTPVRITNYQLLKGVVANKDLGHYVRFKEEYKGTMQNKDDYGNTQNVGVGIPTGTIAKLTEYDEKAKTMTITTDQNVPGMGNRRNFALKIKDAYQKVEVSSLGQREPLDLETEVRKQMLTDFFPTTVLEPERAERLLLGVLMGKDLVLYGPPGGGKSQAVKDLIRIAQQQGIIFETDNLKCKANCNPYSLFDEEFSKKVPPCPDCKAHYDSEFQKTGRFHLQKPEDVKVIPARYGSGNGIVYIEGTTELSRMHLAGFKMPKMEESSGAALVQIVRHLLGSKAPREITEQGEHNGYDFHPGLLILSNNGILHLDEMDKLRQKALDEFLESLNSNRVQPEGLPYPYASNQSILGTANDNSYFSPALTDRMLLLAIRYSEDRDVSYAITRRSYYGEEIALNEAPIGDTHSEKPFNLRRVPLPTIIERAVDALYQKFRKEYNGKGKQDISGSNRCKFDALDAARGKLMLDQLFFKDAPSVALEEYATYGMQFALCSRVQEKSRKEGQEAKEELIKWIKAEFPKALDEERKTWWCRLYQEHIAVAKVQIPEIEDNYWNEMELYTKNPEAAKQTFGEIHAAWEAPDNRQSKLTRVKYPLMDYLFQEQPGMAQVQEKELLGLMKYFIQSSEGTACKVGDKK